MNPLARFTSAYRATAAAQRRWVWALAVFCGGYLPLTIDKAGVTGGPVRYALWAVLFFTVAFALSLFVVTRRARPEPASPRPLWLLTLAYAAPPLAVFCVYLAAYFPAMMNVDSYEQWKQIVEYRFNAFFPIAATLAYWLPSLVWKTPAAAMVVQMTLLALAFGFSMAVAERSGAPRRFLAVATVLFALHPVNGFFSVTYLKDVLFSSSILWLTVIVFLVVRSGGEALKARSTLVHLTLSLAAVALLRPNGPVPAFGTLVLLGVVYRKEWRRLLVSAGAFVALYLAINVGVARATHLSYEGAGFYSATPFIYDIGAILHSDLVPNPNAKPQRKKGKPVDTRMVNPEGKLRPEEREVLHQFENVHEWARLYRIDFIPYWHTKRDEWELLDQPQKKAELVKVWWSLARRYPGIVLKHKVDASRVAWQIDGDAFEVQMETFGPTKKSLKYATIPAISPSLTERADALLKAIQRNTRVRWFVAHPALYNYVALFLFAACAIQRRTPRVLIVAAPLFLNCIATMAFCMAWVTRYFYASYLVLPFAAALAWTSWKWGRAETASDVAARSDVPAA